MTVHPPNPPYCGPAAHTSDGPNKPIHRVIVHSTVSPCEPGGAVAICNFFKNPPNPDVGSAHYIVDPEDVRQSVGDSVVAWHAPGADWSDKNHRDPASRGSIGIEMCDIPGPVPNDKRGTAAYKAAKRSWRWIRPNQIKMLDRTAHLTARLCAAYDVPPVFLSVAELKAGKNGVSTHANVSKAFGQSTHWDPGFWPRRYFMLTVRARYKKLTTSR